MLRLPSTPVLPALALLILPVLARPAAAQPADNLAACLDQIPAYAASLPARADADYGLTLDVLGGGHLRYVGAEHQTDPAHPQFAAIAAAFREARPTVVFYEGPERPEAATADSTIRAYGESGYVRFLAREAGARVARLEPAPAADFGAVAAALDTERAALFFVLREAARLRDRRGLHGDTLTAAIGTLLERAAALGLPLGTLDGLEAAYGRHFTTPADWREAPAAWFDPAADDAVTGGRFMAEANRASSHGRDLYMARVLAEAVQAGERVFAVVGRDHVPMQAAALRCAVGVRVSG
jgi:hypothetical protein